MYVRSDTSPLTSEGLWIPTKEVTVMINRDRAWRRRKTRLIVLKIRDTKNWLFRQLGADDAQGKPPEERKKHKPGKLTRAQHLRQSWSLNQELADGFQP